MKICIENSYEIFIRSIMKFINRVNEVNHYFEECYNVINMINFIFSQSNCQ